MTDNIEQSASINYTRSIGIDIHKNLFVCCSMSMENKNPQIVEEKRFEAFQQDLDAAAEWCISQNPEIITMESTGIYWEALAYKLKDRGLQVNVVNPTHVKGIRGKKTDKKDARWLALVGFFCTTNMSFIPSAPYRLLRLLERHRDNLVRDLQRLKNRFHKYFDRECIKLSYAFSDLSGKNAQTAIQGLIAGLSPEQIVQSLNLKRLKASKETILKALSGIINDTTRQIFSDMQTMIKRFEDQIARYTEDMIAGVTRYCQKAFNYLKAIPGVSDITAAGILIEIGGDVSAFPSVKQFASWLGLCPGDHESAGKRFSGRIRKGNKYVRRYLIQAAHAAARTKSSLGSKCRVLCAKLGKKKGIVAAAHKLSRIMYAMIKNVAEYRDPQVDHEQERVCQRASAALKRIVEATGIAISAHDVNTGEFVMELSPKVPLNARPDIEQRVITQSLLLPGVCKS